MESSCEYCDGTGDVHRADGEWLGECPYHSRTKVNMPKLVSAGAMREAAAKACRHTREIIGAATGSSIAMALAEAEDRVRKLPLAIFEQEEVVTESSVQLLLTRSQADRLLSHLCEVEAHFDLRPDGVAEVEAVRRLLAQGIVEYDRANRARWA